MHRFSSGLLAAAVLLAGVPALAQESARYNEHIAELAKRHHVPERLIHRVIVRESRYNPRALHAGNYGLMQIKPATARGMGYSGSPAGLLDGKTNLNYAVPYLANAYRVAGGNEDRAVQLYAGGYYYAAKRKGMLSAMRTAHSGGGAASAAPAVISAQAAPPAAVQAYAAEPASPFAALASLFSQPQPEPVAATAPEPQAEETVAEEKSAKRKRKVRTARHVTAAPMPPAREAAGSQ